MNILIGIGLFITRINLMIVQGENLRNRQQGSEMDSHSYSLEAREVHQYQSPHTPHLGRDCYFPGENYL